MATTNVVASTNTAYVQSDGSATYSVVRAGNSLSLVGGANDMRVGQTLVGGPEYVIWQVFLEFDLAALAGQVVDSATFKLSPTSGDDSTTDFSMRLRDLDYGTVQASDFVAGASLASTGTLRAHYDTSGGWTPNGTLKSFTDDALAAAVTAALGGTARFVLYSSRQESGTAPTGDEYLYVGGYSDAGPPTITVVHHAASSSAPAELASATATAYAAVPRVAPIGGFASIAASALDASFSASDVPTIPPALSIGIRGGIGIYAPGETIYLT